MIANLLLAFFIIYFAYYMINCYCYFHPRGRKISDYEQENPFLSVLIPARNEEKNIRNAVDSVLKNNYPHLELIVLDDHSTDRTGEILASYSDSRLSVIKGKPLPKGWIGKNWACHQLSQKAKGEILVFSDADTLHSSNGLALLVEKMKSTNADLLSGIPRQIIKTLGEALTVPFIGLFSFGALPHFFFPIKSIKWAAASNGQYQCFKKKTYDSLSGYQAIHNILADDIAFPRLFKRQNKRVIYTNVSNLISSRMYHGFKDAFNGFTKSFYPTINESPFLALLVGLMIGVFFLAPYVLLFIFPSITSLLSLIISLLLWTISCINLHVNPIIAFLHPFIPFVLFAMLIRSVHSHKNKGYLWKGRTYQ